MTLPHVICDQADIVVSYDNGAEALQERLGSKLANYGIPSRLLFYSWVTSTERDYSYLSQIKQYKPFFKIMSHTLKRLLFQAGIPEADLEGFFNNDDMEYITSQYLKLKPRPGLGEMMQTLRDGGFEVWCCSDANIERVKGYFDNAGVPMPLENILSADMVKAGKPEPEVYKFAREKAGSDRPGEVSVFAGELRSSEDAFFRRPPAHIQLHTLGTVRPPSLRASRPRTPQRTSLTSVWKSSAKQIS